MSKQALVVDDSVTMQEMVGMALKELGFSVVTTGDGLQAVEAVKKQKFEVIVTDINMPNMDGMELIRYLRDEEPSCKTIPILVLTTEAGDKAKEMGKKAGANGWMVKPFNPQTLKTAVTKLCHL